MNFIWSFATRWVPHSTAAFTLLVVWCVCVGGELVCVTPEQEIYVVQDEDFGQAYVS